MSDSDELQPNQTITKSKTYHDKNAEYISRMSQKSKVMKEQQAIQEKQKCGDFKTHVSGANILSKSKVSPTIISSQSSNLDITNSTLVKKASKTHLIQVDTNQDQLKYSDLEPCVEQRFMGTLHENGEIHYNNENAEISTHELIQYPVNISQNLDHNAFETENQLQKPEEVIEIKEDCESKQSNSPSQQQVNNQPDIQINFNNTIESYNSFNNDSDELLQILNEPELHSYTNEIKFIQADDGDTAGQLSPMYIPESLLMLVDQMDSLKRPDANTESDKKNNTQMLLYDEESLIRESESGSVPKPRTLVSQLAPTIDFNTLQSQLPKPVFKKQSTDFVFDNQKSSDPPDVDLVPSSKSKEERAAFLITSLNKNGIDANQLAEKINQLDASNKLQLLEALKNVEAGNQNAMIEFKDYVKPQLAPIVKQLPRAPKSAKNLLVKSQQTVQKQLQLPQVLNKQQTPKINVKKIDEENISPKITQTSLLNKQYVPMQLLVFELQDIYSMIDPIGTLLPQIFINSKQTAFHALYYSKADKFVMQLFTNRQTTIDALPGKHCIYIIPSVQYLPSYNFTIQQAQGKSRSKLAVVKQVQVKLFTVFHIQGEEQKTVAQKFIFEQQYRADAQIHGEFACQLPLTPNPLAADIPIILQAPTDTQIIFKSAMRAKSTTQNKKVTLPLQIHQRQKDELMIKFISGPNTIQLTSLQLFDQNGIEFLIDQSSFSCSCSCDPFENLLLHSEWNTQLDSELRIFIEKNKLGCVQIQADSDSAPKELQINFNQKPVQRLQFQKGQNEFVFVAGNQPELQKIVSQRSSSPNKTEPVHSKPKNMLQIAEEFGVQIINNYSGSNRYVLFDLEALNMNNERIKVKSIRIDTENHIEAKVRGQTYEQGAIINENANEPLLEIIASTDQPIVVYFTFASQDFFMKSLLFKPDNSQDTVQKVFFHYKGPISPIQGICIAPAPPQDFMHHLFSQFQQNSNDILQLEYQDLRQYQEVQVRQQQSQQIQQFVKTSHTPVQYFIQQQNNNKSVSLNQISQKSENGQSVYYIPLLKCFTITISVFQLFDKSKPYGIRHLKAFNQMREQIIARNVVNQFSLVNQNNVIVHAQLFDDHITSVQGLKHEIRLYYQQTLVFEEPSDAVAIQFEATNVKRVQVKCDFRVAFEGCVREDGVWGVVLGKGSKVAGEAVKVE
ncbi:Conserved_hypothetical protein [Hexamita inflata]|uniref:Uncharacterized protein n=1 Tax=Hexamita inflata TaxID=28002 RepID=A0ABP1I2T3_9EUKA